MYKYNKGIAPIVILVIVIVAALAGTGIYIAIYNPSIENADIGNKEVADESSSITSNEEANDSPEENSGDSDTDPITQTTQTTQDLNVEDTVVTTEPESNVPSGWVTFGPRTWKVSKSFTIMHPASLTVETTETIDNGKTTETVEINGVRFSGGDLGNCVYDTVGIPMSGGNSERIAWEDGSIYAYKNSSGTTLLYKISILYKPFEGNEDTSFKMYLRDKNYTGDAGVCDLELAKNIIKTVEVTE